MEDSFRLTPAENARVYAEEIEAAPGLYLGTAAVEKPRIVIVGGQPGAGKTKVVELSKREFQDQNVVIVSTDKLRAFHPRFNEIVGLDDKRSAVRTHDDASSWNRQLLQRCMETHRNVILEGVFKDEKRLASLIDDFKKNGYEVVVRFVAVHQRYSVWGIHNRYEKEKIVRGHGRFVPLGYHNQCYNKLLDSAALVEEQGAANCIEVYARDGECLFRNARDGKSWKKSPGAKAAIQKERSREFSQEERMRYRENWERVFEYMEKRHAPAEEIEAVRTLASKFLVTTGMTI